MITAYFDDSGTSPNNDVAAVGGYLGTKYQWDQFITHWQRLLKDYGVEQMHHTDLENLRGEFTAESGWSPTRRNEFVRKAQRIIKRYTYIAVGCAVIRKDFDEVLPELIKKYYGGPYGWCAQECIRQASNWCEDAKHGQAINWVFEAGTKGSGQIEFFLNKSYANPKIRQLLRLNGWAFKGKDIIPLQAADVVAYEIYKHMQNQIIEGGKRYIRRSAVDLFRKKDELYLKYWNKKRLLGWLQEPVLRRYINMIQRHMAEKSRRVKNV